MSYVGKGALSRFFVDSADNHENAKRHRLPRMNATYNVKPQNTFMRNFTCKYNENQNFTFQTINGNHQYWKYLIKINK